MGTGKYTKPETKISDFTAQLKQWSGFHTKSVAQRRTLLQNYGPKLDLSPLDVEMGLSAEHADLMTENCVGRISFPYAIVPYFVLNRKQFVVAMAVEEPSVVAACSAAAKLIASHNGFTAESSPNVMTGQICIYDVKNPEHQISDILRRKAEFIEKANSFCRSMVRRGGGVQNLDAALISGVASQYVVVTVEVNVCDCMGANIVNTICEKLSPEINRITKGRIGLQILTNLSTKRWSRVSFALPTSRLAWKGVSGDVVASRIIEAFQFAQDDVARATTNNKGIMNGAGAVALATGQDWRAIESAAHAFAATKDDDRRYAPLATYWISDKCGERFLEGALKMPIAVGTVGGAIKSHATFQLSLRLLEQPSGVCSAETLAQVILAAGLASNLAALRALAVEGIQRGHMALHAKNVAVSSKVPLEVLPQAVKYMRLVDNVSSRGSEEYMELLGKWKSEFVEASSILVPNLAEAAPSVFVVKMGGRTVVIPSPTIVGGGPSYFEFSGAKDSLGELDGSLRLNYRHFSMFCNSLCSRLDTTKINAAFLNLLYKKICQTLDITQTIQFLKNITKWFTNEQFRPDYFFIENVGNGVNQAINIFISSVKLFADYLNTVSFSALLIQEQKQIFQSLGDIYLSSEPTRGLALSSKEEHFGSILALQSKKIPVKLLLEMDYFDIKNTENAEPFEFKLFSSVANISAFVFSAENDLNNYAFHKRKSCVVKDNSYSLWLSDFEIEDSPESQSLFRKTFESYLTSELSKLTDGCPDFAKNTANIFLSQNNGRIGKLSKEFVAE